MARYYVVIRNRCEYWSNSRNARKHLSENGGDYCAVYDIHGVCISAAVRDDSNKIHQACSYAEPSLTEYELHRAKIKWQHCLYMTRKG